MKNGKMKKLTSMLLVLTMLLLGINFSFPVDVQAQGIAGVEVDVGDYINYMRSIASDSTGAIYVGGDTQTPDVNRIIKLSGGVWTDITGNASIDEADGIAVDSTGNVYVADGDARKVWKGSYDTDAGWVWVVISDDSGAGLTGSFTRPYGITVDKDDNVYVTEGNDKKLKKYTYDTNSDTWAWSDITNGGTFEWPSSIAVDSSYNMFVVDENGKKIKEYSDRDVNGIWEWYDITGGTTFNCPIRIILDSSGNLYVADSANNTDTIKKGVLNNGTWVWSTLTVTDSEYASGIALDNSGKIYYITGSSLRTMATIYDVTFDKNGGDSDAVPASMTVVDGEKMGTLPEAPTKNLYEFNGWNTMADGTGDTYTADTPITADTILYAQWSEIPTYSITMDPNLSGGAITPSALTSYAGEYIYLTVKPDAGLMLKPDSLIYNDGTTDHIVNGEYGFSFEMPEHDVVISAEFVSSKVWDYIEGPDSFSRIMSIQVVGSDNIYAIGQKMNTDRIVKYNGSSWTDITWTDESGDPISIDNIETDGSGNVYVYVYDNDTEQSIVKKYTDGTWSDVVDISSYQSEDSSLSYTVDSSGVIYTVDFDNSEIIKYTNGAWVNVCYFDSDLFPWQLAVYGTGSMYMSVEQSKGPPVILNYTNGAWFSEPLGWFEEIPYFNVDASGNLYAWDYFYNKLYKYSGGEWIDVTGDGNFLGMNDIAIDNSGHIYLAEGNGIWTAMKDYTVTFNKSSGDTEAAPATKTAVFGGDVGTLPDVPTRSGYTFNGWNTEADGSGTAFNAETVITGNITVFAQWKVIPVTPPGGGNTAVTSPVTGNAQTPVDGTALADVKSDFNGNATATVTDNQIKDAVGKALDIADQKGEGTDAIVEIKAEAPAASKSVVTDIPGTAFDLVADSNVNALTISTPVASLTFDDKAIDTIAGQATGDVRITASKADVAALSEAARQAVGDKPVFEFSVTCNGSTISQFGGNVTVSVPYTPKAGEDSNAIVIYYINSKGELEIVSHCVYNPATGMISFDTNHFSKYAVGYNKLSFNDVAENAWYSDAVSFIAARGITSGTGNGKFSPEAELTRAQFLVLVMKAYGLMPDENPKDNFADAGSTYYTGYLAAAKRLGITGGTGNNCYSPNKEISRQEMVTLLYNILKLLGELPKGSEAAALNTFTDSNSVASWARNAMTLFIASGIISGSDGKIHPEDTTSRAQMAQILHNLLIK